MNNFTTKRQLVHTPIKYPPSVHSKVPDYNDSLDKRKYEYNMQRKVESLNKREDAIYSLTNQISQLDSDFKAQESSNYIYEQSLREAQIGAEDFYERQMRSLEDDKLELMRR